MEPEHEQRAADLQLCRLGFAILSFALVLACFTEILEPARACSAAPGLVLPGSADVGCWHWIDAPVVWGSLIGTYLLWGRWSDPGWQRRSGLLMVMALVDAVLWLLDHGDDLACGQRRRPRLAPRPTRPGAGLGRVRADRRASRATSWPTWASSRPPRPARPPGRSPPPAR